ncbi:hypothetical protein EXU57_00965 [Segetibacter sp. 3557_3]|uniref:hypothetical protein n=1 Tax=Segetibacter sp. 3557_3 TaxID=2547429 RepID=UPI0010585CBE|nr:hypothetical protein [Segetibacter sp. 3557_3]TDH28680.1 hypothetical protein EXU57_00965 [Segetibacter sp. 3557_3]
MLRVLLILITLATLFKNVTNCSILAGKSSMALFTQEDEEGKTEKNNEKNSKDNGDQVHEYHTANIQHLASFLKSSAAFRDQKNYCSFHDRPNTPPPNRI